ncbi:MAG: hypothetical protein MEQ07_10850 [Aquimonas sp.]|nr:hypothetical protein [Aquimonas sp.]
MNRFDGMDPAASTHERSPRAVHRLRRRYGRTFCALLAACAISLAPAAIAQTLACPAPAAEFVFDNGFELPAGADLAAAGPFAIASVAGSSISAVTGRTTPWTAHYPVTTGARPLVLFAPGFQIPSSAYRNWAEHLASWGFITVRADPTAGFTPNHTSMSLDLRSVLDDVVLPDALPVSVDTGRIALSGHSLGGKVALMAAAGDARVRALFVFDPVNGAGQSGYTPDQPNIIPQPMASFAVPIGVLGELLDSVGGVGGQACAPAAINYQTIFLAATASPRAFEWTLDGASHTDFITNQEQCGIACAFCQPRTLPLEQTHAFMRASSVAFMRTYLQEEPGLCHWLNGSALPAAVSLRQAPLP